METNIVNAVTRPQFSIQPVKKVNLNPREPRQEQYAAKKKSDKLFSEVLSGEIASIAAKTTPNTSGKLNYGLNSLAAKSYINNTKP